MINIFVLLHLTGTEGYCFRQDLISLSFFFFSFFFLLLFFGFEKTATRNYSDSTFSDLNMSAEKKIDAISQHFQQNSWNPAQLSMHSHTPIPLEGEVLHLILFTLGEKILDGKYIIPTCTKGKLRQERRFYKESGNQSQKIHGIAGKTPAVMLASYLTQLVQFCFNFLPISQEGSRG